MILTTKIINKYNHDYEDPELGPCLSLQPYFIFGATAITIGGYTSGFILEKSCYISNIAWQGINYIGNKYG